MLRKICPGVLAVAAALAMVTTACASPSANPAKSSSSTGTKSSQTTQDNKVLATVNGKNIYKSDFEENLKVYRAAVSIQANSLNTMPDNQKQQLVGTAKPVTKSNRQLLMSIIKTQVITDDCEKEGIRVSRDEAIATLEKNTAIVQNLMKSGTDLEKKQSKETWDSMDSVLKAIGLTLDEYNEKYGVTGMQTALLENKHYQHFVSSQKDLTKAPAQSLYDQYVQGLMKKSNITINDALLNSIK